ncbi:MAG: hypothetical protein ACRD0P_05590 [Stackebrandtia sp.]
MTERSVDFRYAPASCWTLICRPDDPHKTLVREDGALLYGFETTHLGAFAFDRVVEVRAQTSNRPQRITQRTESARIPIVETTIEYADCRLILRAAGHRCAAGHRYDVLVWALRVKEDVDSRLTGIHIDISERGDVRHTGPGPAPDDHVFAIPGDRAVEYPLFPDDTAVAASIPDEDVDGQSPPLVLVSRPQRLAVTHPTGFRPVSGLRTVPAVVDGGQSLHGALVLPLDGGPVADVNLAWAAAALETERSYWDVLPALDLPIQVPAPDIQDMLVAAARNILQARDFDGAGEPVFQVGPTIYRGLWVVDGYFMLEAAQYLGFGDDARRGTRALLAKARHDGSINALADVADPLAHPHTKETGIAIATLVRQWELSGDDDWLREVWPVIRRGIIHIATLRANADALPADHPAQCLMPPAFADGGAAGVRPELTTALWTTFGLSAAARAATHLATASPHDHADSPAPAENDSNNVDMPEAGTIGRMAAELRQAIDTAARRYTGTLPDGHHYLPIVLPGSGTHHTLANSDADGPDHELRPQTATWALAQSIWPGEIFEADDRVVRDFLHLLDSTDDDESVPVESGWMPYRSLWTYYASFAAHVWLYADRPDKAVELLYGMCDHAAPTRVWREEQPLLDTGHDQLWGDMPHNWASAELIRLVRHLAVFETGGTLRLLAGIPEWWLKAGPLSVTDTPTRFGRVSLHVEAPLIRISSDTGLTAECVVHVPPGEWLLETAGRNRQVIGPAQVTIDTRA